MSPDERRGDYISFKEVFDDFKDDINEKLDKTDEKIDALSDSLLDPDHGAIARVKTIEDVTVHTVDELDKIVRGNGKVGLATQLSHIKRDLNRIIRYGSIIVIALIIAAINTYAPNVFHKVFSNVQIIKSVNSSENVISRGK